MSFSFSWGLLELMFIESVMPSNHLIMDHPTGRWVSVETERCHPGTRKCGDDQLCGKDSCPWGWVWMVGWGKAVNHPLLNLRTQIWVFSNLGDIRPSIHCLPFTEK